MLPTLAQPKNINERLYRMEVTYGPEFVLTDKLNGVALLINHKRDDGVTITTKRGKNVTWLAPYIGISEYDLSYSIGGELVIPISKVNPKYKSVRTYIAAILRSKSPKLEDIKKLKFFAFELYNPKVIYKEAEISKRFLNSYLKRLRYINRIIGYNVVYYDTYHNPTEKRLIRYARSRMKKSKYELNGIVIRNEYEKDDVENLFMKNPPFGFALKVNPK